MLSTRLHTGSALILLFSSSLTGCVNLQAVGKFAGGTQALSEASGKFYDSELESDRKLAVMTVDLVLRFTINCRVFRPGSLE